MSEDQIKQALEEESLGVVEDQQDEEGHDNDQEELNLSPIEQKAWNQGWRPQDQFEGNPDNWKTPEAYVLYGEMQEEIRAAKAESRRKEAEFEARIANLNKLHEAQTAAAIADLKAKQRQAVEEADSDEYDRLQTQIDQHEKASVTQTVPVQKDPEIAAWEARNPWIDEPGNEKAAVAQSLWSVAASKPGATAKSALDYVDAQLAKLYQDEIPSNPRRDMPTMTEQSKRPQGRQRGRELTMNDLTSEEREQWTKFGHMMFKDQKEFLKAVADGRKG